VVRRRVTGNGAQVRAAADGWMDRLAYTDRPEVERCSGAERLMAGMVKAGLAAVVAVADSVGAGRRMPNDTTSSLPPVQENTVEHNNNNNIILSLYLRLLLRRCFYNITTFRLRYIFFFIYNIILAEVVYNIIHTDSAFV